MPPSKTLPQILIITPPGRRKLSISLEQHFLKIYFFPSRKGMGGEDYGIEKITKIEPTSVLVTSFG